mmetsp:Transcript_117021/g.372524  ORF Transcript_117021/g.372524 Transcript_117021/m.372524 type:complete len:349 (+) Transcript_117021:62-1108(+)
MSALLPCEAAFATSWSPIPGDSAWSPSVPCSPAALQPPLGAALLDSRGEERRLGVQSLGAAAASLATVCGSVQVWRRRRRVEGRTSRRARRPPPASVLEFASGSASNPRAAAARAAEEVLCRQSGLMAVEAAQGTRVVTLKNFLSEAEIEALRSRVFELQPQPLLFGREDRNSRGEPEVPGCWHITYLHTNGAFKQHFGELYDKLWRAFFDVDSAHWGILANRDQSQLNFRTVEFQEYSAPGGLTAGRHYDAGSLITLDIMVADPGQDFEGGAFTTPELDGSSSTPEFGKGDALFFVSHKFHNVRPVTAGTRNVLVAELWAGPSSRCEHRCESQDCALSGCELAAAMP